MWTAAILAGGSARRLGGRDKSGLVVAGRTILERQLAELGPMAVRVLLVTSTEPVAPPPGLAVVTDRVPGAGALGAIYTALMASTTALTAVVACDMPFVNGRFLAHLAGMAGDADAVLPRIRDRYEPLCAVYARRAAGPIRARIDAGALKIADLVSTLKIHEVGAEVIEPFDPDGTLFLNVNTTDDYERALACADRSSHARGRLVTSE